MNTCLMFMYTLPFQTKNHVSLQCQWKCSLVYHALPKSWHIPWTILSWKLLNWSQDTWSSSCYFDWSPIALEQMQITQHKHLIIVQEDVKKEQVLVHLLNWPECLNLLCYLWHIAQLNIAVILTFYKWLLRNDFPFKPYFCSEIVLKFCKKKKKMLFNNCNETQTCIYCFKIAVTTFSLSRWLSV